MRTETRQIYEFSELSEEAKKKAVDEFEIGEYFWTAEAENTLKAFCEALHLATDGRHLRWSVDPYSGSWAEADIPESWEDIKGIQLYKYIQINFLEFLFPRKYRATLPLAKVENFRGLYKGERFKNRDGVEYVFCYSKNIRGAYANLTGYCLDQSICQPLYNYLKKPDMSLTLADIVKDCLASWAQAFADDMEAQDSAEYKAEHLEANDYEFLEDGTRL